MYYLQQNPAAFVLAAFLLSLLVGSFLNVVILRLPKMLEREWKGQCEALFGETETDKAAAPFNLVAPASHCPGCGHRIRPWENIPLISYLFLRGRCSACKRRIPVRYPAVELATGLLSALVAWRFGFGWETAFALVLTWSLVALSVIDFDEQLLPDNITLPLLWLGLLVNVGGVFTSLPDAVIGAAAGYLALWLIFHLFRLLTGKEGMGYGDFKLLAVFGAWLGWQSLPLIVLLSSLVGAVVGIALIILRGRDRNIPIPFGPYLAAAGWLALLWREEFTALYFRWAGL
ncbi:prepilin peptidase [Alkalilimnicola sp. S0819]|uniref:prepilin peptidase n=1 Tax=Alkalilimnicola sp. S0819 TaxID=2613922 RepID=UPI001261D580|nr:A24 family peptidase [Alkalilimnicola sp. S0819]KAB7623133.1 prepilin peptidase [Alkalilimnicola sp. S0819]MPQ16977.1 prepilin peptidase [Alkalilimnicola sp. S0819]